jgi:hypothetical protein
MQTLAALIFALMLGFTSRGPSMSRHAVEPGTPGAHWEPCWRGGFNRLGEKTFACRPYVVGVAPVGAWVTIETNVERAERLRPAAEVLAEVAEREARAWPGGDVHEFAIALTTAAGWSTGFREDIETGRARGPDGEVCLADATLETARRWSDLDLAARPHLPSLLVGDDREALRRCFTILARGFAHSRVAAGWLCRAYPSRTHPQPIIESAFAVYGTGGRCFTGGRLWWAERRRFATFQKWEPRTAPAWPAWLEHPPPLTD